MKSTMNALRGLAGTLAPVLAVGAALGVGFGIAAAFTLVVCLWLVGIAG
jgi:hypothetical protein